MPAVIRFLGYDPIPVPTTLGERMRVYRLRNGLSIKEAARRVGLHEDSWADWERTGQIPWTRHQHVIDKFLGVAAGQASGAPAFPISDQ